MMLPILLLVWLENNFFYVVIVGIGISLINETINLSIKSKRKFFITQKVLSRHVDITISKNINTILIRLGGTYFRVDFTNEK